MATFEQAIFTSACTQHGEGYHLTSRSTGISDEIARELSRWGPSHDCLAIQSTNARSVNFCRLSDGSICTSQTVAAGAEHSGRAGEQMLTHFLIATEEAMLEFRNDPFALLYAADALGVFDDPDVQSAVLPQITLAGRASSADHGRLEEVVLQHGNDRIIYFLWTCLTEPFVAVAGLENVEEDLQALLQLLPIRSRVDFSFSTALRHSPRRPFQLLVAPADDVEYRRLQRTFGTTMIDMDADCEFDNTSNNTWMALVAECLANRNLTELATATTQEDWPETLRELGNCPLSIAQTDASDESTSHPSDDTPAAAMSVAFETRANVSQKVAVESRCEMPGHLIGAQHGELMDQLGQLDDVVFDAVAGNADAQEQLQRLWPEYCRELDPALIEESKEQYLRYVVQHWQQGSQTNHHDSANASDLLNILSLLFDSE